MTAEDLIEATNITFDDWEVIKRLMIEYAKLHVTEALKEAGIIADEWENSGELSPEILNAYPLNNIK